MASAKPYPLKERQGTPSAPSAAQALTGPTGAPGTEAGSAPGGAGVQKAGAPMVSVSANGAVPLSTSYPSPFDRYQYFAKYRMYPISPIGKLFFSQEGGNFVCSAAAVAVNEIWTAGHCTSAGDGSANSWSTNIMFCPSYDSDQGGVNPAVGCWAGDGNETTTTDWFNSGDLDRDFGAMHIVASGTLIHTNLGNAVGWEGFAWNQARDQLYTAFGYPQAAPFTGGKLITVESEFAFTEDGGSGTDSQSIGNDMTGGSSGGPWLWQYGTGNYINGHNDWRFNARPLEMNSPYFDDTANNVRTAQNF
jgi:V8-like Glu-specific endopeptidase